ncbi:type II toxin-antitoxin system RelE/ParE family toxin [Flavobacterium sp.]|uniref:type II toxin-antitoxin system RelE/ParE family toxin n=1 Tax=Flavobacterium sp. TaxID=239 RepID=UPI00286DFDF0|nr:type II toxin-antitoxin system RelE/ParE family toxin [Flavobacterium sp.]
MKNGYKILWTDNALSELKQTVDYLEAFWTEKELRQFARKLDHTIEIISRNPEIFPSSIEKIDIRKAVVTKHNSLYYRIKENNIELISLFGNKQNPDKKKI